MDWFPGVQNKPVLVSVPLSLPVSAFVSVPVRFPLRFSPFPLPTAVLSATLVLPAQQRAALQHSDSAPHNLTEGSKYTYIHWFMQPWRAATQQRHFQAKNDRLCQGRSASCSAENPLKRVWHVCVPFSVVMRHSFHILPSTITDKGHCPPLSLSFSFHNIRFGANLQDREELDLSGRRIWPCPLPTSCRYSAASPPSRCLMRSRWACMWARAAHESA